MAFKNEVLFFTHNYFLLVIFFIRIFVFNFYLNACAREGMHLFLLIQLIQKIPTEDYEWLQS